MDFSGNRPRRPCGGSPTRPGAEPPGPDRGDGTPGRRGAAPAFAAAPLGQRDFSWFFNASVHGPVGTPRRSRGLWGLRRPLLREPRSPGAAWPGAGRLADRAALRAGGSGADRARLVGTGLLP